MVTLIATTYNFCERVEFTSEDGKTVFTPRSAYPDAKLDDKYMLLSLDGRQRFLQVHIRPKVEL